ncbi:MAG: bifunctional glutamate N-acetyltransferase/amino-acid acetyltransferase ArgJ [Armatimonadota bacterium]
MIPKGFRFAGVRCGLKNRRNDMGLIICDADYPAAGVFTTNQFRASCVDFSRTALAEGALRGLVVNSGNANCATGEQGAKDTARMAQLVAESVGIDGAIAVASTGVIGHQLDMKKVEKGIHDAAQKLSRDPKPFIEAILTTDLVEKWAAAAWGSNVLSTPKNPVELNGDASVYGVCKGSGMISPNMATMLGYLVTDLDLSHLDIKSILIQANRVSFNCMTVDSDTSTNDMVILIASGLSGIQPSETEAVEIISRVCTELAKQVAKDGEGATKLIEVRVTGTENPTQVARSIADSPLVKTAMFGCDPNWGRVIMATGKSGVPLDVSKAVLHFEIGDERHLLFEKGEPTKFDPAKVSTALKADHVIIDLRLGEGAAATIYTCDFGYGYVRINAEYHT